jgi:hypothetical protein
VRHLAERLAWLSVLWRRRAGHLHTLHHRGLIRRAGRPVRCNPRTSEAVAVKEALAFFKAGKDLRGRLNRKPAGQGR